MNQKHLFHQAGKLSRLQDSIGEDGLLFLRHGLGALDRLLPHAKTDLWKVRTSDGETRVKWNDSRRRELGLSLSIRIDQGDGIKHFTLETVLRRRTSERGGVTDIPRTIDDVERSLCEKILARLSSAIEGKKSDVKAESLGAIAKMFDELVVAAHLKEHLKIQMDVAQLFSSLRELAEQSYENKSLTFGLIISEETGRPEQGAVFPRDFFEFKRYRAMSDGFKTAFRISSRGKIFGLVDLHLKNSNSHQAHFYPEWCQYMAESCKAGVCGVCLTRQGDILIFESGNLRFTYRCGNWQYWNHRHVIDILRNRARVQHVAKNVLPNVVRSLYRATLDVSFRRSGGLFVLLRNRNNLRKLVPEGEAIGDADREKIHATFDESIRGTSIQKLPRTVLSEIAGLDGGVVIDNHGRVLAYASVLKTRVSGKLKPAEGSRTKAAISASRHGIAVKISSDGDITCYENAAAFLKI